MSDRANRKGGKKVPAPKKVAQLRAAKYNPRKHSQAELERMVRSFTEFGDLSGIVFNRRTGNLIGGHQRRTHLPDDAEIHVEHRRRRPNEVGTVATGWIEIEGERWSYREVDVPPAREKAMNIAANRHGEGAWDRERLPDLLSEISTDFDLDVVGFSDADLKGMGLDFDLGDFDPGDGRYVEQYGVIVVCEDEREQERVFKQLQDLGLGSEIRVVVT